MRAVLVGIALLAWGCDSGEAALPRAVDPGGAFEVALLDEGALIVDGPRTAWEMDNGLRVTAQRFPVSDSMVRERGLSDVVGAIVERFDLGEVDGSMVSRPCTIGERETTCLVGTTTVDDENYVRRGFVVQLGDELVWIEAIGAEDARALVDEQAELFEQTFQRS